MEKLRENYRLLQPARERFRWAWHRRYSRVHWGKIRIWILCVQSRDHRPTGRGVWSTSAANQVIDRWLRWKKDRKWSIWIYRLAMMKSSRDPGDFIGQSIAHHVIIIEYHPSPRPMDSSRPAVFGHARLGSDDCPFDRIRTSSPRPRSDTCERKDRW